MDGNLSVVSLLEKICGQLAEKFSTKEIILPCPVFSMVASDWDEYGYMLYKKVNLLRLDQTWVLGLGSPSGYPADLYAGDILAFEIDTGNKTEPELAVEIEKIIENKTHFRNTLLIGLYDGGLSTSQGNSLSIKLREQLVNDTPSFVSQLPEYGNSFYLDGRRTVEREIKYKKEFVDYLVNAIKSVLRKKIK